MNLAEMQTIPNNIHTERAMIASIVSLPDIMYTTKLSPDMFYGNTEKAVFKAICELRKNGRAIDTSLLYGKLHEDYKESMREIVATDHLFTRWNEYEVDIIEKYTQRKLIKLGSDITSLAFESSNFDKIRQITSGIMMEGIKQEDKTFMEVFQETVDSLGKRGDKICDYGYKGLMRMKGYIEGNLIVIGARPKVGKSAFVLNLIDKIAEQGVKSVLFSLEMNAIEISERFISMYSATSSYRLDYVNNKEKEEIANSTNNKLSTLEKIQVVDNIYKADDIFLNIRKYAHDGYKIIFIDYLQLIQSDGKDTKNDKIGAITAMLKRLASELKICIVILSQLNRDAANSTPELHNLRDSGNIEQDANVVMLLHITDEGKLDIIIAANRSGQVFETQMDYIKEFYTIKDEVVLSKKEQEDEEKRK